HQDPDKRDRSANKSDDTSANQFGTGYDGVHPDEQEVEDTSANQFGVGYDGTVPSASDDANQFGVGYDGTAPSTDDRTNQFGTGYAGVDDSVVEDPYGDRVDEQDSDDVLIDAER
ncbi:MAG: hypothetical protein LH660_10590, partial [Phormidesmis sp. CAN_BIN36]|nr:hypothetical protein [Phormidesmis sp. CAN_BIN36]